MQIYHFFSKWQRNQAENCSLLYIYHLPIIIIYFFPSPIHPSSIFFISFFILHSSFQKSPRVRRVTSGYKLEAADIRANTPSVNFPFIC